ncbi:unnamed protein product [Musa textilis]
MERGGAQIEDKRQGWSCIRLAVEELSLFRPEEKKMSTLAFLGASNLLLHVLDQIGPTMMVLRQDIQRNIERVEETYMLDPNLYSSLEEIVQKEVVGEGSARQADSCCRSILWLARHRYTSILLLTDIHALGNQSSQTNIF